MLCRNTLHLEEVCRVNRMWVFFSSLRGSMTLLCVHFQSKIQCLPLNCKSRFQKNNRFELVFNVHRMYQDSVAISVLACWPFPWRCMGLAPHYADGLSITKLFTELQLNYRNLPDKQCSGQIISSKLFSVVYLSKSLQEHESFFGMWLCICGNSPLFTNS